MEREIAVRLERSELRLMPTLARVYRIDCGSETGRRAIATVFCSVDHGNTVSLAALYHARAQADAIYERIRLEADRAGWLAFTTPPVGFVTERRAQAQHIPAELDAFDALIRVAEWATDRRADPTVEEKVWLSLAANDARNDAERQEAAGDVAAAASSRAQLAVLQQMNAARMDTSASDVVR